MNLKLLPTGRIRRINLKEHRLCHAPDCLSHASYLAMYRHSGGLNVRRFRTLCRDHAICYLGLDMYRVIFGMIMGGEDDDFYERALNILRKIGHE